MSDWTLKNPPVWEAVLGARTAQPVVYDPYNVRAVHDLFVDRFPRAERQPALDGLEPFALSLGPPVIQFEAMTGPALTRWWFTTPDSRNLVQIQEDFIARNWRRTGPERASDQGYPAFAGLQRDFADIVSKLSGLDGRTDFPPPRLCDLLYINAFPMRAPGGERLRLRDALPFIQFADMFDKYGMSMSWLEHIPGAEAMMLHVQLNFLPMPAPDSETPVMHARIAFNARGPCSTWSEHQVLAEKAHDFIRERLVALTTDAVRSTWST